MPSAKQAPRFLPTLTEVVHKSSPLAATTGVLVEANEVYANAGVTHSIEDERVRELVRAYLEAHLPALVEQHVEKRRLRMNGEMDAGLKGELSDATEPHQG